jgi:hypothetical protein
MLEGCATSGEKKNLPQGRTFEPHPVKKQHSILISVCLTFYVIDSLNHVLRRFANLSAIIQAIIHPAKLLIFTESLS